VKRALSFLVALGLWAALSGCAHGKAADAIARAAAEEALWNCQCLVSGLATGFDEVGGEQRIWVAAGREVTRVVPGGEPVVEWRAPRFTQILRLESGDLDGDGVDEWVVMLKANSVRSVLIGRREGRREALAMPWNGYLRIMLDAEAQPTLVGQGSSGHRPFFGPVHRIELSEDGKLRKGAPLGLPAGTPLFDFFWLPGSEAAPARLFSLEPSDQLAERDLRSPKARTWRSDSRIVARPVEIEREFRGYFGEQQDEFIRLAAPIEVSDPDGDGVFEALLVGGTAKSAVVFETMRFHQGGDVRLLAASDRGLVELRRSALLGRAVAAASSWSAGNGRRYWVAAVWTRHRAVFKPPESRLLLLDAASGDLVSALAVGSSPPRQPDDGQQ